MKILIKKLSYKKVFYYILYNTNTKKYEVTLTSKTLMNKYWKTDFNKSFNSEQSAEQTAKYFIDEFVMHYRKIAYQRKKDL